MERFGFVGLPNAGKSSLFNALAGGGALAAPYPFATKEPNIGRARIPDHRLDALSAMSKSKETIYATSEFVDIGGLVEGAHKGEGLGNKFLANIREVDSVVFVLRAFEKGSTGDDVPGPSDPLEHLATVEIELALADLVSVETQLEKTKKLAKSHNVADKAKLESLPILERAYTVLADGTPIYRGGFTLDEKLALAPFFLLTNKPVLVVVNVGEDDVERAEELAEPVQELMKGHAEVLGMCLQLEAEAAQMVGAERQEMLDALGLGDGALPRLMRSAFELMGRRTYFTTGEKETRAWVFRAGAKAPECAGVIHTDFQRGFIKADCIRWDELIDLGGWVKAREVGKVRMEGREYIVEDGDVMEFRFNV